MKITKLKFCIAALVFLLSCSNQVDIEYYPTGVIKKEIPFNKKNNIDGELREYYENGKLEASINYKDGIKHGEVRLYREDGSLEQKHSYVNGKLSNKIELFYPTGELSQIQFYDSQERLVDVRSFGRDGERLFDFNSLVPIIIPEHDTINFTEEFESKIRLGNSRYNWINVVICERSDSNFLYKPTLPKLDSATAILRIKPDKEGDNIVEGYILDINKHYPDSVLPVYFQKKFYVRKQKRPETVSISAVL